MNKNRLVPVERHDDGEPSLPLGYRIERDADLLTLHRVDGSRVAAFVPSAEPARVARVAEEDSRACRRRYTA